MDEHPRETPNPYPADKARQGDIVLRRTYQRLIFGGGLVVVVLAGLVFVLTL